MPNPTPDKPAQDKPLTVAEIRKLAETLDAILPSPEVTWYFRDFNGAHGGFFKKEPIITALRDLCAALELAAEKLNRAAEEARELLMLAYPFRTVVGGNHLTSDDLIAEGWRREQCQTSK